MFHGAYVVNGFEGGRRSCDVCSMVLLLVVLRLEEES